MEKQNESNKINMTGGNNDICNFQQGSATESGNALEPANCNITSVNSDSCENSQCACNRKNKPLHKLPVYEKEEEILNVITHALGASIGVVAAIAMIVISVMAGSAAKIVGSVIFGFGLIWLYTMSTMYHNEKDLKRRRIRQKFDHLSINILIASSVTFFMVSALANTTGYIVAAVVWALSIIAMTLNSINVKKYRAITMTIYILTGWMPIFLGKQLYYALGLTGLMVLLAGGLFYTIGTIAYSIHKKYMHAIWHVFVLGGSISHIVCAIWYVLI